MERVILILAMLAGLHLILSFLRTAVVGIRNLFESAHGPSDIPGPDDLKTTDWRQYDVPAYVRRKGIDFDPGRNGNASFEVIA